MRPARMARGALLVLALAAAACGAAQREPEPLDQSVRVYNEGVRWQRFDDAASRLPADRRDDFLDQRDQLHDDLRISEYDVIRVRYDNKQRRARVQIKYTWYLESRGVVHETHAVQTWHRGEEIWVMRGERYLRGERMPGLEGSEPDEGEPDESEAPEGEPEPDAPEPDAPEPGSFEQDLDAPAEGDPALPPPGS
jgi:hypothetical protein